MSKGYHELNVPDPNAILDFSAEFSEMRRKIESEAQGIDPADPLEGILLSPEEHEQDILEEEEKDS